VVGAVRDCSYYQSGIAREEFVNKDLARYIIIYARYHPHSLPQE
jgi:hypothetical protein